MIRWMLITAFLSFSAQGATVVVIQGSDTDFSRRTFAGFSSAATERISAFRYEPSKEVLLFAQVKKLSPDLIFVLGQGPIKKLSDQFPTTPILISSSDASNVASKANIVFLESQHAMGRVLDLVQTLFPNRKAFGTVYNPTLSKHELDALVAAGAERGQKVASIKVDTPADVKAFINAFAGKIDVLWWIRDSVTTESTAATAIVEFADQNNIPIISDDPAALERGAALALTPDPFSLGQQAWKTAKGILTDKKLPQAPVAPTPNELTVTISLKSAARFGLGADSLFAFFQRATHDGYTVRVRP